MNDSISEQDLLLELADDFAARYRRGEHPPLAEYTDKFPALAAQIRDLFPALVVMEEFGSVAGPATGPFAAAAADTGPKPERLGEYRILREVGRGGMGIVYEAVQESLGRHVALKVLPGPKLLHGNYLKRFQREARAAAGLHHTNIVPVFGVGEHDGVHYYAMQFIQGQALDSVLQELQRLRDTGSARASVSVAAGLMTGHFQEPVAPELPNAAEASAVPPAGKQGSPGSGGTSSAVLTSRSELTAQPEQQYFRSVAQVGVQVAEALAYAHQQGILHRDIKPSNLLLDRQGTVWVTDFGLAKAEGSDELTSPGDIVGTLRFMAPERFDGRSDARSDVFSLGLTLYEMLTLRPAFAESDRARLIKQIGAEAPPRPRTVNPHIPRDLETVVLKASAREPGLRYASAGALAEDLRRFLTDRPIKARRTAWLEHARRWCLRNKVITSLGSFVLVLLIVLSVGVLITNLVREERDRAVTAENEAQTLLQRAVTAEQENKIRGHLLKAGTHRRKGQMGQRFQALAEVKKALLLNPSAELLHELRNEAIACLALPDVRVAKEWDGYPADSSAVCFDGALKQYARLDAKGFATIYRVADNSEICQLSGMPTGYGIPMFSADGQFLAVRYHQARLKVWHLAGPKPAVVGEAEKIVAIAFSPDNKALVAGQANGTLNLLDLTTKQWRPLGKTAPNPYWADFHPGGKQLAVACQNCTQILKVDAGELVAELPHKMEFLPHVAWHPDGKRLAVIGGDLTITLWDVAAKKPLVKMHGLVSGGHYCSFNPTGDLLVSTGWDQLLRFWNPLTGKELFRASLNVVALRFSPDGRLLAGSREGARLQLLEITAGREYRTLLQTAVPGQGANLVHGVAVSPDGKLLASGMADGVCFWDLAGGQQLASLPVGLTRGLLFDAAGALLFNVHNVGVFRCPVQWDAAGAPDTPDCGWAKIGPAQKLALPPSANSLGGSHNGKVLANAYGSLVGALDLEHPGKVIQFGPMQDARFVAISPDGRYLAAGNHNDVGAKVWDRFTKKLVKELPVGGECSVTFSPDGKWLATGSGGCSLWHVDSWEPGPSVVGTRPTFSPDGKVLAVETGFGTIRLIDPKTGAEYAQLEDPKHDRVRFMTFTLDGAHLVMASADNDSIHVCDLRSIRQQLKELRLDWSAPPCLPAPKGAPQQPLQMEVDLGPLAKPGLTSVAGAKQVLAQYLQKWNEQPNSARTCNNLAWAYLMAPAPLRDVKAALPLAQKAVQLEAGNAIYRNTLGVAYYRAGQYAKAVAALQPNLKETTSPFLTWDLFFLAMSHQKLGETTQARLHYDLGLLWAHQQKDLTPDQAEELAAIRAEAEEVLGVSQKPVPKAKS